MLPHFPFFALRRNCLSTQRVAPFVTFTPVRLASAHSFLSFSPCIELCLSGRPGGRTTQRLLHLPPSSPIYNNQNETSRPLCAHSDSGPCFFSVSFNSLTYLPSTPHPSLLTPLVMSCFSSPPLCPPPQKQTPKRSQVFPELRHNIRFSNRWPRLSLLSIVTPES